MVAGVRLFAMVGKSLLFFREKMVAGCSEIITFAPVISSQRRPRTSVVAGVAAWDVMEVTTMTKNYAVLAVSALMLVSSCGTYTGQGAYTGATFGSILGSAIGGISDGPRGHDIGTVIGMAGGAMIGGVIGSAQDQRRQQRQTDDEVYSHRRAARSQVRRQAPVVQNGDENYGSGFDANNGGDDRIEGISGGEPANQPVQVFPGSSSVENIAEGITYTPVIEIRNARFVDADGDNVIGRGELCHVVFEVFNHGAQPIYDIQPMVVEATANRHLYISPGVHVERIDPGKGIRYTAVVKADNRLKAGNAKICVSVIEGNNHKISKVTEFNIPTRK